MTVRRDPDVLILGGGVIGLAAAHYLLEAGRSVRVLEQNTVGSGSSHGNCGTITPSHAPPLPAPGALGQAVRWMLRPDAPLYVPPRFDPALWRWFLRFARNCSAERALAAARSRAALLHASRQALAELITNQCLQCEFLASGLSYVFRDSRMFEQHVADIAALSELGIDAVVRDAARLEADEPCLREGATGSIFFKADARLRPDRYVNELARVVRAAGGVIEENCTVTALCCGADSLECVRTTKGDRQGCDYLLALGAWSPRWSEALGIDLPIQPGKGYSITYTASAKPPTHPLVLKERSVCVTAWPSGFRLGSTMEFSGYDNRLNPVRLGALERAAREYLVEPVGPMEVERWCGWRPMSCDDVPIIGPSPRQRNLMIAGGHGMLGVSMSAATGHLVADLLCGRMPLVDPHPYRPGRFTRR